MAENDLYLQWLKIPPGPRPPDHYALLAVPRGCKDVGEIEAAAHARLETLDRYALHPKLSEREACQEMMNQVARAKIVLSNDEKRSAYDLTLGPVKGSGKASSATSVIVPVPKKSTSGASSQGAFPHSKPLPEPSNAASRISQWITSRRAFPVAMIASVLAVVLVIGAALIVAKARGHARRGVDALARASDHSSPNPDRDAAAHSKPTPGSVSRSAPVKAADDSPRVIPKSVESAHEKSIPSVGVAPATPDHRIPAQPPAMAHSNSHPSDLSKAASSLPLPTPRSAIPSVADQDAAKKLVYEVFGETLAGAKTPAEKTAIAKKMLGIAAETEDKPAARFVLYLQAGTIAATAGDITTAFQAVDNAGKSFQVDSLRMKSQVLNAGARVPGAWHENGDVPTQCFALIDLAVDADRYDVALTTANAALSAARKAHDAANTKKIISRLQEINNFEAEFQKTAAARAALERSPTDPAANNRFGRFRCFVKEDWAGGLPLLAQSGDPAVRAAALAELEHSADPLKQIQVADAWWDLCERESLYIQAHLKRHALEIYKRDEAQLSGLMRLRVKKRIGEVEDSDGHSISLRADHG